MSDTMKAALDAALRFHDGDARDLDATVASARRFHQEIAGAAPAADDPWDEEWFGRVGMWLRSLSGDQLGSVRGQLQDIEMSRHPGPPQPPAYAPVPPSVGRMQMQPIPYTQTSRFPEAAALLDQLNQTPYQGPAPIGPVLVPGELLRIRPEGADVYTTATVAAKLEYDPAEGFRAFVPPGAFSEAAKDQIEEASATKLLELLAPAGLRGTIAQQVKELVGTVQSLRGQLAAQDEVAESNENRLRRLVGAVEEFEDDDTYVREQPTEDAVRRLVIAYIGLIKARQPDVPPDLEISADWRRVMLEDVQRGWSAMQKPHDLLPGEED